MCRSKEPVSIADVLDPCCRTIGAVFGNCTKCDAGSGGYGSPTPEEVLVEHLGSLTVPACAGAMIGHIADKFTAPIGIDAEMNADAGTIRLLESAVVWGGMIPRLWEHRTQANKYSYVGH